MKVSDVVYRDDLYPRIRHDPALVQRYATNVETKLVNGSVLIHSEDLWVGALMKGTFYVGNHHADFCEAVYREWINGVQIEDKLLESEYRDDLASTLVLRGWKVSKEIYTSQGRIDILAEKDGEQRIIETKLSGKSNDSAHALGQLLFYSKFYPKATLWLSSPEMPDETILSILKSFNVNFWEIK